MTDSVEPPEVALWNKAAAVQDEELLFYAGQALAAALVAALRYRYAAEKQVSWSIGACRDQEERANAAEAEVVRLREALAFATNTPFMNQRTVPYPSEEPNP